MSLYLGNDNEFSHGQMYVALSRVSDSKNIIISTTDPEKLIRNVVFKEIFTTPHPYNSHLNI